MKLSMKGYVLVLFLGLVMIASALAVTDTKLSGVVMGLGAGLSGMAAAQVILWYKVSRDPGTSKAVRIEQSDERNITIDRCARARAFSVQQALALPAVLSLVLGEVHLWAVLLCLGVFCVGWAVYFWNLSKLRQEM